MKGILFFLIPLTLLNVLFLPPFVAGQTKKPSSEQPDLRIAGSTILADISSLSKSDRCITSRELAMRATQMIAQKGTTYVFNVCDFLKHNGKQLRRIDTEIFQPYSVQLTTVTGEKRHFQIGASKPGSGTGCFAKIAAVEVTSKEMTVIADGKPVRLLRPPGFRLSRSELFDETSKRAIRRWEVPFQLPPLGISPDGLKLYLNVGVDHDHSGSLNKLALELSHTGVVRFRAREDLNLKRTEGEPDSDAFVRFRQNGRSFILVPQYNQDFIVLIATGLLVPPEPIYPIETRPFPQRNPTSYEFPGPLSEVRQKILAIFNDDDLMRAFKSEFSGSMGFHFSVEDRESALFVKHYAKDIYADEKNKNDLFLHSDGELIGGSSLYLGGGRPLPYGAEFQLHFTAVDPNKTRVSLLTHNPRVYNGDVCCGLHGYKSNTVTVEPTTIEEYEILLFIGRRLGVSDMPMLRRPDDNK